MSDRFRSSPSRKIVTVAMAVGALIMSCGLVLVASSSASASKPDPVHKTLVCHATDSDTNPYVALEVDVASTKFQGHLQHRNSPNKTWKTAGSWNGIPHSAGAPKPDYIAGYTYLGVTHPLDGPITSSYCYGSVTPPVNPVTAVPEVQFTDPSCATPFGDWDATSVTGVTYAKTSGDLDPGSTVVITATADPNYQFVVNGKTVTTQDFSHTFTTPTNCTQPVTVTPGVQFTDPTCTSSTGSWVSTAVTGVSYAVKSGDRNPGSTLVITATAAPNYQFVVNGQTVTTQDFSHTFTIPTKCSGPLTVTPGVQFTAPTCDNPVGSYTTTAINGVSYSVTGGDLKPGDTAVVTATASGNLQFDASGTRTKTFSYVVPALSGCPVVQPPTTCPPGTQKHGDQCETVSPPVKPPTVKPPTVKPPTVKPPKVTPPTVNPPAAHQPQAHAPATQVVTPTVVHAGLASMPTDPGSGNRDLGLALSAAGALVLLSSGWLGFGRRRRGVQER